MDRCKLFIGLFIISTICYSQIKTDFLIADSGATPVFDFDTNNKIQMVWTNNQKRDKSVQYSIFDSLGNIISATRRLSTSINGGNPSLAIKKDYIACIWEDKVSLDFTVFSTYIIGKILKNGLDYSEELHIDDGDILQVDAIRYTPQIIWRNDSMLYSVWAGSGSRSFVTGYSDIYTHKLLFSPFRKSHPLDTVLNNSRIKIKELLPTVIERSSGIGYLAIWVEKDSLSVLRIAGVTCDDSLRPNSSKITFVNFDSVKFFISKPAVFHKQNGNIVIVWERDTTNFQANIFFQEFTELGIPVSTVVKVNESPASVTSSTVADIDSEGRYIIVWEEWPNLKAQRYTSNGAKIGTNFKLNHTQTNGDYYPVTQLRNNKIYTAWNRTDINGATSVWMNILDYDNPTVVKNEQTNLPRAFTLSQNYPNPFNPTTTINYQLQTNSKVSLKIYDILGREVVTLVNEVKSAGTYSTPFNSTRLASGVYFYRIEAASTDGSHIRFTDVKKMMYLK